MTYFSALAQLSDETLHGEVKRLVGRANTLMAELLAHLAEVEARGIHRERACSSLYTYCVYELYMSEDEAQRRCRAARLARDFPRLLEMLANASIHLTGILLIGPHLTTENQTELLARVQYRTKREIERIVGEISPAPELPARIDVLHGEQPAVLEEFPAAPARARCTWAAYVRALAGAVRERSAGVAAGEAPPRAAPEKGRARYRMQVTIDQDYLDLLEEARELLQHAVPDRDIAEVQRRALQTLVKGLRARKAAVVDRPRAPPERKHHNAAPARSRHVPSDVRRSVWQRDDGRCAYVDTRGQRCRERGGIEVHHRHPHAWGGPHSVDNLELRCRAHNALAAEQDFGRERIRELQRRRKKDPEGLGSTRHRPAPG